MKLTDLVTLEQEMDPVETARNNLAAAKENLKTLTAQCKQSMEEDKCPILKNFEK